MKNYYEREPYARVSKPPLVINIGEMKNKEERIYSIEGWYTHFPGRKYLDDVFCIRKIDRELYIHWDVDLDKEELKGNKDEYVEYYLEPYHLDKYPYYHPQNKTGFQKRREGFVYVYMVVGMPLALILQDEILTIYPIDENSLETYAIC